MEMESSIRTAQITRASDSVLDSVSDSVSGSERMRLPKWNEGAENGQDSSDYPSFRTHEMADKERRGRWNGDEIKHTDSSDSSKD